MRNESPPKDRQQFTKKQIAVIEPLLAGKTTKEIALQLGISTRAVEYHLTLIYEKLGVSSRTEATVKLIRLFKS